MTAFKRLVHIDDDPGMGNFVRQVAEGCGYEVRVAEDAASFREAVAAFQPNIIVLDISMPEVDGFELIQFLAEARSTADVLLLSGYDERLLEAAHRLGEGRGLKMAGALTKPIRLAALRSKLEDLGRNNASISTG